MENSPITSATVNGQDYFRVPLPSGMCAFVKFEEEAQNLRRICNAHEQLLSSLRNAYRRIQELDDLAGETSVETLNDIHSILAKEEGR